MVDKYEVRIAKRRKAQILSQRTLVDRAKALDTNLRLSHSALGGYKKKSTMPHLAEAVALADILDVSLDFLLRGEANRTLPLKNLTDEQLQLEDERLLFAISKLSPRERYVLYARAVDECSFKEIAVKLNVSYKGVAAVYYRAVTKVKSTWG